MSEEQSGKRGKVGEVYSILADVVRDIRAPLASLLGFLDLLQQEPDAAKRTEYVEKMSVSGKALLDLVNGILDAAESAAEPEGSPVDLRRLAASVLQEFESAAAPAAGAGGILHKPVNREQMAWVLSDVVARRGRRPCPANESGGIGDGCPRPAEETRDGGKTP